MAPVLSERLVSDPDTSAPFSTTTLITSIAVIISSIVGVAIVAAVAIIVISIRRRIRENLEATIAREFVPTVVVTDTTTYPYSTSIVDLDNRVSLGCAPSSEKVKQLSTSPRGSIVMPVISEEDEEIGLEEEKAEFLIAHPDEIEEFDQTLDHQFKTVEKLINVKRNGQLFPSETTDTEKADIEVPMTHRDSIQLYGGPSLEGSIIRSLHKTLDEHQELASETSRYSWETEGSSRVSDSDVPVYPGEEDIASTSIEASKLDITPVVLESKTFTSSAASLLKQFWQFSSQESIRRKAATQGLLTSVDVSPIDDFKIGSESNGILSTTEAIEAEPLDPAILKYCWHLDGEGTPRESLDTDADRSATLEDCVVSHSYTTSKSLDSICFIQRRSTDVTVDDGAYYDVPTMVHNKPPAIEPRASTPEQLTRTDSRDSGNNVNSRRARFDARKSKSASILDSLYLGRQNWNKKRHAKMADKEKAMQEFAKIQRTAFNDYTNLPSSH